MAKFKGAIVVNTDRCKGCQLCIVACPKDVIALAQKKVNVHGYPYVEAARPDDCIGCPFVPQEVVFVNAGDIGLTAETGEFGFSYCPQLAQGYRWRLAGINKHTTFPHSVSSEKITMK